MKNLPRWITRVALLSLVFAATTLLLGWWSLAVVGVIWGFIAKGTMKPALTAGVAAASAWAILLSWSAATGPVGLLVSKLGGIADMPGSVFVGLTLLLPFALAFAAARVTRP